jgi:hypothetical protein
MAYGKIEYNKQGKAKCEICGEFFHRPAGHARQKHDIDAYSYKKKFGLETVKGICSPASAAKSRKLNAIHYQKVVVDNLHDKGKDTRFVDGCSGRTIEQVSAETMVKLKEHGKNMMKLKHSK